MEDAATIRSTIIPWRKAVLNRDWDGLMAMCTDDFMFSPPGAPQVSGAAVKPWLEAFPPIKEFDFSFDNVDVRGDLAVARGRGLMIVEMNGKDVPLSTKFVDVFRRGKDGIWRYAHVIFNYDGPGA